MRSFICALLFAPAIACSFESTPASTGIPDEACAGKYGFTTGGTAFLRPGAASCTLRYPLTARPYWHTAIGPVFAQIRASIVDNGPARVIMKLKERNHDTNVVALVATMDSDVRPASNEWQSRRTGCAAVDFEHATYWVEVVLLRSEPTGNPRVGPLRFQFSSCDSE